MSFTLSKSASHEALAARVLERWEHVTQTLLRAKAGAAQQADWALLFRAAHVLRRLESRHSTRLMRAALDDAAPADGALAARPSPGAPKRQATRRGAFG